MDLISPENNPVLQALLKRHSVRTFADKQVEPEKKEVILQAAFRAPTAGAMMLYTILDITDQAVKEKLAVSCDNQPFIAGAPLVFVFLADFQRQMDYYIASGASELCTARGEALRTPGPGELLLAANDAIIAAQTAVLAAEALGLGSCYIGDILENYEFHRELFKLPDYAVPVTMLCLGYPRAAYPGSGRRVPRYNSSYVVHDNKYRRFEDDDLKRMTAPFEGSEPGAFMEGAENYGQHTFLRKFNTDFSREMNRSIQEALKPWME